MKRSDLVLTLLAALVAATLGARENLHLAPTPIAPANPFYAMNVQAVGGSDTIRKPEGTKG
jgi:hypothetical protein